MAQMCTDNALDLWLGQFPLNTAKYTSPLALKLFTSQTASTVVAHNGAYGTITETTYTSYADQALAAATWGSLAERAGSTGRQTTYPQVTFPTVGASGATINGFYITNNGETELFPGQANFDDVTAVVLVTNDVIKVTPTIALLH